MQLPERTLLSSHRDQENLYLLIYFNLPTKFYVLNPLNKLSKFSKPENTVPCKKGLHVNFS